jgi:hypothetical protein
MAKNLDELWGEYCRGLYEYARAEFDRVVKPYLVKNKYSIYTGGCWGHVIKDKKDITVKEENIPKEVQAVLDIRVPGISTDFLSSFMPSFKYNCGEIGKELE